MKQKEKIIGWIYEEYKKYVSENEIIPDFEGDEQIINTVLDKINDTGIWLSDYEKHEFRNKETMKPYDLW